MKGFSIAHKVDCEVTNYTFELNVSQFVTQKTFQKKTIRVFYWDKQNKEF
jgi:hypothetical protein